MNPDAISTMIEETSKEFPILGYTISVNLNGVEISHADLLQLLTPLGFGTFLPPVREPATTLRRAMAKWLKEQSKASPLGSEVFADEEEDEKNEEKKIKQMIREVASTRKSDILTLALVLEGHFLAKLGLSYLTNLRVFLDKKTGEVLLTTDAKGSMERARQNLTADQQARLASFLPFWEKYRDVHLSGDLHRMIRDIYASLGATTMRKGGGVYFLPYAQREGLIRFQHLVESLPAEDGSHPATLLHLPIVDTKTSKRQMARIAHEAFLGEVAALQKELDTITKRADEKAQQGKALRIHTTNVLLHMEKYKGMKAKAALYQEALGMRQSQVTSMLGQLQQQASHLLEMATGNDETEEEIQPEDLPEQETETATV